MLNHTINLHNILQRTPRLIPIPNMTPSKTIVIESGAVAKYMDGTVYIKHAKSNVALFGYHHCCSFDGVSRGGWMGGWG